jgi:hypothetical protein
MKIETGIASTTHIDQHNDQLTKSTLDNMAEQINEKFIPQLIEHDWDRHVGVILYGEVFQLDDGAYALGVVSGIFENEEEKTKCAPDTPNIFSNDYKEYLDINKLKTLGGKNKKIPN